MPKTIQVGPYLHRVISRPEEMARIRVESGNAGVYGQFWWHQLEIHIDPDVPADLRRECLLHEVRHAIWHVLKIDNDVKLSEEEFINRETPLLLDTLRRNPELVAFLTEGT